MSELRATPGHWAAVRKHPHIWAIDALSGDPGLGHVKWHSLADVYGCDDMGDKGAQKARANAHLIAAAPLMHLSLANRSLLCNDDFESIVTAIEESDSEKLRDMWERVQAKARKV